MFPLLAAVLLSGCAQLVVDADGTRHLMGFMVLTLPKPADPVGADVMRMRTLGLALTRGSPSGMQVVLGYGDTTLAALRNDSAVSAAALRSIANESIPQEEKP